MNLKTLTLILIFFLSGMITTTYNLNSQVTVEPIKTGFVFFDGKYIDAPYIVESKDLAVYINGIQITKRLQWPVVNQYAFDHDPGLPPNINKYTTFEEATKLTEPTRGVLYLAAKQWYLFTHFNYDEAYEKTIEYIKSFPNVKNLSKDKDGFWVLESYSGEKRRIAFGGPRMQRVNEIWGPNGSGPPNREEFEQYVNKLALRYKMRLKKGDLFLIFSDFTEISFGKKRAAFLLQEMLNILKNNKLSMDKKLEKLISVGFIPGHHKKLCNLFIKNFKTSQKLENRISEVRKEIKEKYERSALKSNIMNNNKLMKVNNNPGNVAYSPDGVSLYAWCGYTYDPAFQNFYHEINAVWDYLKDQDYQYAYIYTDDTEYDNDCGSCFYISYKGMKDADFLYQATHGWPSWEGGYIEMILLETESQINNWSNNDPFVIPVQKTSQSWPTGHPWAAVGKSTWPAHYWKPTLTQSNSISILSCCYSYENGWAAACVGGVAFGYNTTTTGWACENNNEQLLKRMNGKLDDGQYRKSGDAFVHMPYHLMAFSIAESQHEITLCPALDDVKPKDGDEVDKSGTGYVTVDTYCHDWLPADQAVTFTTTGNVTINNIHWEGNDKVNKVSYDWNGRGNFDVTVTIHHEYFQSWGEVKTLNNHFLDCNGIAPNTEDSTFTFSHTDKTPPTCKLLRTYYNPYLTIEASIQDDDSGLKEIKVLQFFNCGVSWPSFQPGTRDPVILKAMKIDPNQQAYLKIEVKDMLDNSQECDPLYTTISATIPENFQLHPNFPNPFNPTTTIHFDVPAVSTGKIKVQLKVYDILGREVRTLIDEEMEPGSYSVQWDGRNNNGTRVSSGVYLYRMKSNGFISTRKMVLLK